MYETFVTFESCPLTYSHRDLLLNSIHNIQLQNTLLSLSKYIISPIVTPSSALWSSYSFLLLESTYLGNPQLTGFILDSARTMH